MTQSFATSWWWLLDEAMIGTTNFWRGERGEPPLIPPDATGGGPDEVFEGVC